MSKSSKSSKKSERQTRLEKKLGKIEKRQKALAERLAELEGAADPVRPRRTSATAFERHEGFESKISFLDQFRAGEALGEASLGAWIEVCRDDALRGGLRTVQMREGMHARLLAQRLEELGATPRAEVPLAIAEAAMKQSASTELSDAEKLQAFMSRFADIESALAPIVEMANRLDPDPETQDLLRTICQDERSTLEYLAGACGRLSG